MTPTVKKGKSKRLTRSAKSSANNSINHNNAMKPKKNVESKLSNSESPRGKVKETTSLNKKYLKNTPKETARQRKKVANGNNVTKQASRCQQKSLLRTNKVSKSKKLSRAVKTVSPCDSQNDDNEEESYLSNYKLKDILVDELSKKELESNRKKKTENSLRLPGRIQLDNESERANIKEIQEKTDTCSSDKKSSELYTPHRVNSSSSDEGLTESGTRPKGSNQIITSNSKTRSTADSPCVCVTCRNSGKELCTCVSGFKNYKGLKDKDCTEITDLTGVHFSFDQSSQRISCDNVGPLRIRDMSHLMQEPNSGIDDDVIVVSENVCTPEISSNRLVNTGKNISSVTPQSSSYYLARQRHLLKSHENLMKQMKKVRNELLLGRIHFSKNQTIDLCGNDFPCESANTSPIYISDDEEESNHLSKEIKSSEGAQFSKSTSSVRVDLFNQINSCNHDGAINENLINPSSSGLSDFDRRQEMDNLNSTVIICLSSSDDESGDTITVSSCDSSHSFNRFGGISSGSPLLTYKENRSRNNDLKTVLLSVSSSDCESNNDKIYRDRCNDTLLVAPSTPARNISNMKQGYNSETVNLTDQQLASFINKFDETTVSSQEEELNSSDGLTTLNSQIKQEERIKFEDLAVGEFLKTNEYVKNCIGSELEKNKNMSCSGSESVRESRNPGSTIKKELVSELDEFEQELMDKVPKFEPGYEKKCNIIKMNNDNLNHNSEKLLKNDKEKNCLSTKTVESLKRRVSTRKIAHKIREKDLLDSNVIELETSKRLAFDKIIQSQDSESIKYSLINQREIEEEELMRVNEGTSEVTSCTFEKIKASVPHPVGKDNYRSNGNELGGFALCEKSNLKSNAINELNKDTSIQGDNTLIKDVNVQEKDETIKIIGKKKHVKYIDSENGKSNSTSKQIEFTSHMLGSKRETHDTDVADLQNNLIPVDSLNNSSIVERGKGDSLSGEGSSNDISQTKLKEGKKPLVLNEEKKLADNTEEPYKSAFCKDIKIKESSLKEKTKNQRKNKKQFDGNDGTNAFKVNDLNEKLEELGGKSSNFDVLSTRITMQKDCENNSQVPCLIETDHYREDCVKCQLTSNKEDILKTSTEITIPKVCSKISNEKNKILKNVIVDCGSIQTNCSIKEAVITFSDDEKKSKKRQANSKNEKKTVCSLELEKNIGDTKNSGKSGKKDKMSTKDNIKELSTDKRKDKIEDKKRTENKKCIDIPRKITEKGTPTKNKTGKMRSEVNILKMEDKSDHSIPSVLPEPRKGGTRNNFEKQTKLSCEDKSETHETSDSFEAPRKEREDEQDAVNNLQASNTSEENADKEDIKHHRVSKHTLASHETDLKNHSTSENIEKQKKYSFDKKNDTNSRIHCSEVPRNKNKVEQRDPRNSQVSRKGGGRAKEKSVKQLPSLEPEKTVQKHHMTDSMDKQEKCLHDNMSKIRTDYDKFRNSHEKEKNLKDNKQHSKSEENRESYQSSKDLTSYKRKRKELDYNKKDFKINPNDDCKKNKERDETKRESLFLKGDKQISMSRKQYKSNSEIKNHQLEKMAKEIKSDCKLEVKVKPKKNNNQGNNEKMKDSSSSQGSREKIPVRIEKPIISNINSDAKEELIDSNSYKNKRKVDSVLEASTVSVKINKRNIEKDDVINKESLVSSNVAGVNGNQSLCQPSQNGSKVTSNDIHSETLVLYAADEVKDKTELLPDHNTVVPFPSCIDATLKTDLQDGNLLSEFVTNKKACEFSPKLNLPSTNEQIKEITDDLSFLPLLPSKCMSFEENNLSAVPSGIISDEKKLIISNLDSSPKIKVDSNQEDLDWSQRCISQENIEESKLQNRNSSSAKRSNAELKKIGFQMKEVHIDGVKMFRYCSSLWRLSELTSASESIKKVQSGVTLKNDDTMSASGEAALSQMVRAYKEETMECNSLPDEFPNDRESFTSMEKFFLPYCKELLKYNLCQRKNCPLSHQFNGCLLRQTDFSKVWTHMELLLSKSRGQNISSEVFVAVVKWLGSLGKRNKLLELSLYLASLSVDSSNSHYLNICWSALLAAYREAGVPIISAAQNILQHLASHTPPYQITMLQNIIHYIGLLECDIEEVWSVVQVLKTVQGFHFPIKFYESMMFNTITKNRPFSKDFQNILEDFTKEFLCLNLKSLDDINVDIVSEFSEYLITFKLHHYDILLQNFTRALKKIKSKELDDSCTRSTSSQLLANESFKMAPLLDTPETSVELKRSACSKVSCVNLSDGVIQSPLSPKPGYVFKEMSTESDSTTPSQFDDICFSSTPSRMPFVKSGRDCSNSGYTSDSSMSSDASSLTNKSKNSFSVRIGDNRGNKGVSQPPKRFNETFRELRQLDHSNNRYHSSRGDSSKNVKYIYDDKWLNSGVTSGQSTSLINPRDRASNANPLNPWEVPTNSLNPCTMNIQLHQPEQLPSNELPTNFFHTTSRQLQTIAPISNQSRKYFVKKKYGNQSNNWQTPRGQINQRNNIKSYKTRKREGSVKNQQDVSQFKLNSFYKKEISQHENNSVLNQTLKDNNNMEVHKILGDDEDMVQNDLNRCLGSDHTFDLPPDLSSKEEEIFQAQHWFDCKGAVPQKDIYGTSFKIPDYQKTPGQISQKGFSSPENSKQFTEEVSKQSQPTEQFKFLVFKQNPNPPFEENHEQQLLSEVYSIGDLECSEIQLSNRNSSKVNRTASNSNEITQGADQQTISSRLCLKTESDIDSQATQPHPAINRISTPERSKILSLPFPRGTVKSALAEHEINKSALTIESINTIKVSDNSSPGVSNMVFSGTVNNLGPFNTLGKQSTKSQKSVCMSSQENSTKTSVTVRMNIHITPQKLQEITQSMVRLFKEKRLMELFQVAYEWMENGQVMENLAFSILQAFKSIDNTIIYLMIRDLFQILFEYQQKNLHCRQEYYNLYCLFGTVAASSMMEAIGQGYWKNAYEIYALLRTTGFSETINERFIRGEERYSQVCIAIAICEVLMNTKRYADAVKIIIDNNLLLEMDQWVLIGAEDDVDIVRQMTLLLLETMCENTVENELISTFLYQVIESQKSLRSPINVIPAVQEIIAAFYDSNPSSKADKEGLREFYEYLKTYDRMDDLSDITLKVLLINFIRIRDNGVNEIFSLCVHRRLYPELTGKENYLPIQSCWQKEEMWFVLNKWFESIAQYLREGGFYESSDFIIKYQMIDIYRGEKNKRPKRLFQIGQSIEEVHARFIQALSVCNPPLIYEFINLEEQIVKLHTKQCHQIIEKKLKALRDCY